MLVITTIYVLHKDYKNTKIVHMKVIFTIKKNSVYFMVVSSLRVRIQMFILLEQNMSMKRIPLESNFYTVKLGYAGV